MQFQITWTTLWALEVQYTNTVRNAQCATPGVSNEGNSSQGEFQDSGSPVQGFQGVDGLLMNFTPGS